MVFDPIYFSNKQTLLNLIENKMRPDTIEHLPSQYVKVQRLWRGHEIWKKNVVFEITLR
jgi:hypothetical protein